MAHKDHNWVSVIELLTSHLERRRPVPELKVLPGTMVGKAQALVAAVGVPVVYGGTQPAYSPSDDTIFMPHPGWYRVRYFWKPRRRFCCDLLHELAHSTGHKNRLARPPHRQWGDHCYSQEELVAELSSCLLMADLGIQTKRPMLPHGRYLLSWMRDLDNPKLETQMAMGAATRAAGYVVAVARRNLTTPQRRAA